MVEFGFRLVLALTILFAVVHSGLAIKCYKCDSKLGDYCGKEYEVDTTKLSAEECSASEDWCMTEGTDVDGETTTISRGCATEKYCKTRFGTVTSHCIVCQPDRCNSSSTEVPFMILGVIGLILIKFSEVVRRP